MFFNELKLFQQTFIFILIIIMFNELPGIDVLIASI